MAFLNAGCLKTGIMHC